MDKKLIERYMQAMIETGTNKGTVPLKEGAHSFNADITMQESIKYTKLNGTLQPNEKAPNTTKKFIVNLTMKGHSAISPMITGTADEIIDSIEKAMINFINTKGQEPKKEI